MFYIRIIFIFFLLISCCKDKKERYRGFNNLHHFSNSDGIKFNVGIKDNQLFFLKQEVYVKCLNIIPSVFLETEDINKDVNFISDDCNIDFCCNMISVLDSINNIKGKNIYYISQILIEKELEIKDEIDLPQRKIGFSIEDGIESFNSVNDDILLIWPYDI